MNIATPAIADRQLAEAQLSVLESFMVVRGLCDYCHVCVCVCVSVVYYEI